MSNVQSELVQVLSSILYDYNAGLMERSDPGICSKIRVR